MFDKRKKVAQMAVLGALYEYGPMPPFEIAMRTGLGTVRLYEALTTLEREHNIVSWWEDPFGEKPRRRIYQIPRMDYQ